MTAAQLESTQKELQKAVAPRLIANAFRTLRASADPLGNLASRLRVEKRFSFDELRELERELAALMKLFEPTFPAER